jgi:hypothetical protein
MTEEKNSLAFWFPPLQRAGLPVPKTRIVKTEVSLIELLDGQEPTGMGEFIVELARAADEIGFPCFLRTGHGSGKHDWADTCYVARRGELVRHICALVEWSNTVDIFGLSTDVWVVRELIQTKPLFYAYAFGGFPVTREFRLFVRDAEVEGVYPYWPADALEPGQPDAADWRDLLAAASTIKVDETKELSQLALRACAAVGGGYWSVDFLQDVDSKWWLTDMAEGERSYRPGDPHP